MIIRRFLLIALLSVITMVLPAQVERQQQQKDACSVPMFIDWSRKWLTDFLTWESESEMEKVCNIYSWLTHQVRRKRNPFYKRKVKKYHPGCILFFKAATDQNYAKIFKDMCEHAGIKSYVVSGYVKDVYYCPGDEMFLDDHHWNVVRVDSQWYVMDVSWGAGHFEKRKNRPIPRLLYDVLKVPYVKNKYRWVKEPNSDFYFADPREFVKTHLPADPRWQLLETPIPKDVFENGDDRIERWLAVSGQDSNRMMDVKLQIEHYGALQPELKMHETAEISVGFNKHNHRKVADGHAVFATKIYQRMETKPPRNYESRKRIYRRALSYYEKAQTEYELAQQQMKKIYEKRKGKNDRYNKKYTDFNKETIKFDGKQIRRNDRILDKLPQTNKRLLTEEKRVKEVAGIVPKELKEINRPKREPTGKKLLAITKNDSLVNLYDLSMEDESSLRKFIKEKNIQAQDSIVYFRKKVRRLLMENEDELRTNIVMTIDYDRCNKEDVQELKKRIGTHKTSEDKMRTGIEYEDKETLEPNFKIQRKSHQNLTRNIKKAKSLLDRNKKLNMEDKGEDRRYEDLAEGYKKETKRFADDHKQVRQNNQDRIEPIRREQQRLRAEVKKLKLETRLENHRHKKENKWHKFVHDKEMKRYGKGLEYVKEKRQYVEDQIQWLDDRTENKAREAAKEAKEQARRDKDFAREQAKKEKDKAAKEARKAKEEAEKEKRRERKRN